MNRMTGNLAGFLLGSLKCGEGLGFDAENRIKILEAGLVHGRGKPLLFEITGQSMEETHDLLARSEQLIKKKNPEADLFYFITPLAYHGNRDLPHHLQSFGPITTRRIILSNNPELVGHYRSRLKHRNIRTSVIKKIAPIEQVVGLEYDGDLSRALNYQRAMKLRQGFRLYDGNEIHFLNRPSSSGLISMGAPLAPEPWSDVVNSSLHIHDSHHLFPDHLNRIWQHGQLVRRLLDLYQSNPAAFIKAGLKKMNVIPESAVTPGTTCLTSEQIEDMENLLTDLEMI